MHFEGEQTINAPIEAVWAYFMDPNKVAQCAPGFKSMEIIGPDHFKPILNVGVGPVKTAFKLDVTLGGLRQPNHAEVAARGNAAGSAVNITSTVDFEAKGEAITSMHWIADVAVSGTIASVGARLMESTAEKLTAKFFDCTRQHLEPPSPAAGASSPSTTGE
ncbi:MAG: CoxG family protein [Ktedonobacterales bacterium]